MDGDLTSTIREIALEGAPKPRIHNPNPDKFEVVEIDGEPWLRDRARPTSAVFRVGGSDPFTREEWADYDSGRIERCSPELAARQARHAFRDRDGF